MNFFGFLGFNRCVQFFWYLVAKDFYISYTEHFFFRCAIVFKLTYIHVYGGLPLLYNFFVILWPKPFTLVYSICASTKIPFEPVQKLFLSTGFLGRYQVTSAWVLKKVTRLRTILWSAAG